MASRVLYIKVCSPLKLRRGVTGKKPAICHYSYNLPLAPILLNLNDSLKPANYSKMKRKNFNILLICLFVFTSCTISNIHYLSRAKQSPEENYGFSKENPILVNVERLENKEKIVEEYISRLYSLKMKSGFQILKRNVITNSKIEEYILVTDNGMDTLRIYFNLNKRIKGLKYPNGFIFGQLSGK